MRQPSPTPTDESRHASVRDHLANERTFLSWVRLSIAISALGFVVARFGLFVAQLTAIARVASVETGWSVPVGVVLVLAGPVFGLLALFRYLVAEQEIETGRLVRHHGLIYAVMLVLIVIGAGLAIYLVAVAATVRPLSSPPGGPALPPLARAPSGREPAGVPGISQSRDGVAGDSAETVPCSCTGATGRASSRALSEATPRPRGRSWPAGPAGRRA